MVSDQNCSQRSILDKNSWAYSMNKTMRPKNNYNKNQVKSNPDKMSFSSMLIDRPS